MLPATKIILQIQRLLRRRSLVGNLVSFVAVVNQGKVDLLGLDAADVNLPWDDMNVFHAEDFETVLVGILDVVSVGNPGAVGAPVIEGIIAAFLNPVFVGEVGLPAQCIDRLLQKRSRLARVVGVVHVEGGLSGGLRGGGRGSGLGTAQRREQQNKEKTIHDSVGLEAP